MLIKVFEEVLDQLQATKDIRKILYEKANERNKVAGQSWTISYEVTLE